jgi:hypothetical protein
MTNNQILCAVAGAALFYVGFKMGQKRAGEAQAAQAPADPMAWFAEYGSAWR